MKQHKMVPPEEVATDTADTQPDVEVTPAPAQDDAVGEPSNAKKSQQAAKPKKVHKRKAKVNMILKSKKHLVQGQTVELTDEEIESIEKYHPIENVLE